jgi:uncharacterized protein YdeI (YjbR/CyaY-like superfamily)
MEIKDGVKTFYARDRKSWRAWLSKNHDKEKSVWLIIYKKGAAKKSTSYAEAVEEALCFGWIDSKPNKRDVESFYQFFAKRNPSSNWSKINKDRVKTLIDQGLMTPSGMAIIEQAKLNGKWDVLDDIENLVIPDDLRSLLAANHGAEVHFNAFPRSVKKGILEWILNAKTAATRDKRMQETVTLAAENIRANQYRPKQ